MGTLVVVALAAGPGVAQVKPTGVAKRIMIESDLNPREVQAKPGDTLIWRNARSTAVVVSLDGVNFSDHKELRLEPGASVSMFFSKPGTYQYTVQQAGAPAPPPLTGTVVITG
jgi:plastocyanin